MASPFVSSDTVVFRSRGYVPHLEIDNGIYFVTFRLADSLPADALRRLDEERRDLIRLVAGERSPFIDNLEISCRYAAALDRYLDQGYGSCPLRIPEIADSVRSSLKFHDEKLYRLICWCVMPNHVHVIINLFRGTDLAKTLQSWKSYTSHKANALLNRTGAFWEREYFDRLIRNAKDLAQTREYVLNNPAKAGLQDWPWVGDSGKE